MIRIYMMLSPSTLVLTRTTCVWECEPGFPLVLIYADGHSRSSSGGCAPVGGKMASAAMKGSLPLRVETEPTADWGAVRDFGTARGFPLQYHFRS